MSLREQFKTDQTLERQGVVLDYGTTRVTIARAGGANRDFARVLEAKTRPFKRAIQTETMDNVKARELIMETYVDAVIRDWQTKVGDEWKQGIEGPSGELVPFTKENVLAVLKELPDLFDDIQAQANKAALYRQVVLEADAGN